MRKIAQILAVAGALAGLGLSALPASASPAGASGSAGRSRAVQSSPTPAQRTALARAEHLRSQRDKRGIITGSVRRPGGAPEANVCVVASGPLATRKTFSRPDGRFVIAGLPRGAYRVEYRGCSPIGRFTGQWYGGLTRAAAAKVLVTGAAPTELAPVTLGMISPRFTRPATPALRQTHLSEAQRPGSLISRLESGRTFQAPASVQAVGHVSGRVTSRSGHPLARICVLVAPVGARFFAGIGRTSATGRYRLRVRPGRYYVVFLPTCAPKANYAPQLWKAAASIAKATVLRIAAHQDVTHIDAVLGTGAMITGRVRSHVTPHPSFRGLCIVALGTGGQRLFEGFARIHADGTFRLPSLATGKYRLIVDPFCGRGSPWLPLRLPRLVSVTDGKTTSGITAFLTLGGTITGTVKDTNGTKLSGICVQAFSSNRGAFTVSTAKGTYRLQGLTAGNYQLTFETGCGNRGPYAPLLLPNPVAVRAGVTTPHVNAVLQFDGSLTGTVRNSHGQPLGGICVVAESSGLGFAFARTKADGTYTAKKVAPGSYQVQFIPGGVFSDCGNKGNYLPESVAATVSSLATTTADGVLPTGGIISGVVKDSHGRPVGGVCAFSSSEFGGVAATKSDGSYQLRQLFTDSYFVGFQGGCGNTESVAPLAYRNDPTFFGPTSIPVTAGQVTTGIDVRLRPGATIKGAVRDQAGRPVNSVCVFVIGITGGDGGGFLADVQIDRNGRYTSANLPPGQYAVFFSGLFSRHRGCGPSPYADQQFGGQGIGGTLRFISVPGGRVTTGVDTTLSLAGTISGVVTNTSGKPVSGICVTATNRRTGASTESFSGSHGAYKLIALPAGPYAVEFSSCGGDFVFFGQTGLNYANQWYKGHSTEASADTVAVRPQQTTPNIDAALTKGALISGQVVYKPSQRPISFVCVFAFTPDFSTVSFGLTDRAGRYVVDGLSTGRYFVEFDPCSGESALAGQVRADQLHIVAGQSVHGIDEQLRLGGSVSGVTKVSLPGGTRPAPGTCVEVLPLSQTATGSFAFSGQGGKYLATNLAPGRYEILAGDPGCSSDAPTLSAGTFGPVQVAAGKTTAAAGIALPVTGAIAGVVRGPGGQPLNGICAEAVPLGASLGVPIGVTAAAGASYRISDLQPGRYKVMFTTGCGATGFATRWYKNARTSRQATVIKVSAAMVTGGINARLPRG